MRVKFDTIHFNEWNIDFTIAATSTARQCVKLKYREDARFKISLGNIATIIISAIRYDTDTIYSFTELQTY